MTDLPRPSEPKPGEPREASEIEAGRALFAKVGCATCHSAKLGNVEGFTAICCFTTLDRHWATLGSMVSSTRVPRKTRSSTIPPRWPRKCRVRCDAHYGADGDRGDSAGRRAACAAPPNQAVASRRRQFRRQRSQSPLPGTRLSPSCLRRWYEPRALRDGAAGGRHGGAQFDPSGKPVKRPTSGPASRFEWRTPPLWGFRDSGPYLHDGLAPRRSIRPWRFTAERQPRSLRSSPG